MPIKTRLNSLENNSNSLENTSNSRHKHLNSLEKKVKLIEEQTNNFKKDDAKNKPKKEQISQKSRHLWINRGAGYVVGMEPLNLQGYLSIFNYIHRLYSIITVVYHVQFVITQYIEIAVILGKDFFEIAAILGVAVLYSVGYTKRLVCMGSSISKIKQEIENTEEKILAEDDEEVKEIYMEHVRLNYKMDLFLIIAGWITIVPFWFGPLLELWQNPPEKLVEIVDNSTVIYLPRPLPFQTYFFFDRYKYYKTAYALHVLGGFCGGSNTVVSDILMYGLLIYAVGQIKILQHKLKNFKKYAAIKLQAGECSTTQEAHRAVIKECIHFHLKIIKYVEDLDKSMKYLMLLDFALASLQMAMLGFQIIFSDFGIKQLFASEYLVAVLIEMAIYHWHANEITLESGKIGKAIWDSDWFDCDEGLKKILLFVLLRASKPMTVNIGPFFEMSTQSALAIARGAYSYVALLRQTYIRKQGAS